nr:G protein-coupled receptor [Proales similis]
MNVSASGKLLLLWLMLCTATECSIAAAATALNESEAVDIVDRQNISSEFERTNFIALNYIWPTIPIGFLVLGTVCNILSIIVFTRKEMRKFSSFCYFAILNGVNLAVLYVTMIRVIMNFNFHTDLRQLSLFSCKLHVFLTYFLGHLSSMLLCVISIDRVISVTFLQQAKTLCTPRIAFISTICLVVFNFILSSHFLFLESGYVITKPGPSGTASVRQVVCESRRGTSYDNMIQNSWKLIDMSIYAFIPFFIMFTCSVIIIARVAQQSRKFRASSRAASGGSSKHGASTNSSDAKLRLRNAKTRADGAKVNSRTKNLALFLIPVNILFLMFLAPVVITMYFHTNLAHDHLTLAIVELLSYCNFTINFFVYFITSSKFREEFYKIAHEYAGRYLQRPTNSRHLDTLNATLEHERVHLKQETD